jgi:putative PIN family toxin of toxin-antitoxin system
MTPPRIVLDSNVIISAFLFGGQPRYILYRVLDGSLQCFISLLILDEVRDVLQRPEFGLSSDHALSLVEQLHDICCVVTPRKSIRAITADPDDNRVLECAAEAGAGIIVSGDSHLLALGQWGEIRILSPADFIRDILHR